MMNDEILVKGCYLQGATSMLGLLISAGMPPWHLDDLEKQIRVVREIRRGEGK